MPGRIVTSSLTILALTACLSASASTGVMLYQPGPEQRSGPVYSLVISLGSFMKWPLMAITRSNSTSSQNKTHDLEQTVRVTKALQPRATSVANGNERALYPVEKIPAPRRSESAESVFMVKNQNEKSSVAVITKQAHPTPPINNGYRDMQLNRNAPVQASPGANAVIPLSVKRVETPWQKLQGREVTGELEMADLYHQPGQGSPVGGDSYPVYLACYSRPDYEPSKGYLVEGNFRVLGFLRVSGYYDGEIAVPEDLDDNGDPRFGRDISEFSNMYSKHCSNFLETCMSFDRRGELVQNCWAGGHTRFGHGALERAYEQRFESIWQGSAGNSTASSGYVW